jgi:hypothetical protein
MRKYIVVGVLVALCTAMLALPAFASFDHHFSVIAKLTSSHRVGAHVFRFRDKLVDPQNRHDRVGRDRGRCKSEGSRLRCHSLIHLNGEIGGFGTILVRGDLERHDNRLNVVGGTHNFDGVAGKEIVHSLSERTQRLHFDLIR